VGASALAPVVGISAARPAIGASGKAAELALRAATGGVPQFFRTAGVGACGRFVDAFVNGAAHEAKAGLTSLTQFVQTQIAKDAYLLANGRVSSVTWHFYTSSVTGVGGWTQPLYNALTNAGIQVVRH
jgi:filamentous hemagglutinin